ncbi:hypothetical protein SORBI_3003G093450 [Sorghum bicolor]|uniref:Uncharacterized protein n=1 Tax=Sorghum bicolor TaxID=4558 RepID=A0A1W0VWI7_SORBI|nr:hypothetical protein SORBI_3003G093450 [Sorghum bicolor]
MKFVRLLLVGLTSCLRFSQKELHHHISIVKKIEKHI